ncbi:MULTISPECIES: hypothetical protein [unclassified Streptomyces]|uniref:hypothetical protein n=1 Tax=unclassified Streptomyces TaxID=2593676 RepID=UPI00136EC807|nr:MULTISPECIES: hypothetical protein [unclassified Streptomyces]NEA03714.1 hypothetical protein [Streptomyces sp. SID10116]MYY79680.1 hypothetical protein [Streptomyces sp. SID335]MYZ12846.1 hypothetical protein [Streptomyces sp. SID337]NDZ91150.1 hypothetical protein [Streptomyces sp. SID10115]NEB43547.1 hypothetical protein [Streptomyces sp. SID339]
MTAPRATKSKRPAPKIRENLPAPQTPEGQLFCYTPYEAAKWTPYSGRTLADMIAAREIDYVRNDRDNYLTGAQIIALVEKHTVRPFKKSTVTKSAA